MNFPGLPVTSSPAARNSIPVNITGLIHIEVKAMLFMFCAVSANLIIIMYYLYKYKDVIKMMECLYILSFGCADTLISVLVLYICVNWTFTTCLNIWTCSTNVHWCLLITKYIKRLNNYELNKDLFLFNLYCDDLEYSTFKGNKSIELWYHTL